MFGMINRRGLIADQRIEIGERGKSGNFNSLQPRIFSLAARQSGFESVERCFETRSDDDRINDGRPFEYSEFSSIYKAACQNSSITSFSLTVPIRYDVG